MQRAVWVMCLAVFVVVVGTGSVAPLLAPYAQKLGAAGVWVGLLFSFFYGVRLLVGVPIGYLADRRGPKAILTISLLLYPLIAIAYWLAGNIVELLGARLLHGLASAMLLPMAMAYMGEMSPRGQEGKYMGLYNTVLFVANGVGPLLGGWIGERWGTEAVFLWLLGLSVAAIGVLVAMPSVSGGRRERKSEAVEQTSSNEVVNGRASSENVGVVTSPGTRSGTANAEPESEAVSAEKRDLSPRLTVWRNPGMIALAGIQVQVAVLSVFLVSFFPLFAASRQFSLWEIGLLIAMNNLVVGALQVPLGRVVDRWNKSRLIWLAAFMTAVLLFVIPWLQQLGALALVMVGVGITSAVTIAASSAQAAILGRAGGMGRVMGFLGSASSFGMIVGPLLSGWLLDTFRIEATFTFSSLVWLLGTLMYVALWGKWRTMEARVETNSHEHTVSGGL